MKPKRRKTMRDFESTIEKQIREARERGEFDDLPGLRASASPSRT